MRERNARRVSESSGTFQLYGEVVGVGAAICSLGGGVGARDVIAGMGEVWAGSV